MPAELDIIAELVASLEADYGVPTGFIANLPLSDEWSFAIKAQALVEAAVTQLILASLGRTELSSVIESTNLLGRSGKLAMARALGLIGEDLGRFAERLGQLRNGLVHDVTKASFTFSTHLDGLSKGERDVLLAGLLFQIKKPLPPDSPFLKTIAFAVWMHLLFFLAQVNAMRTAEQKARGLAALEAEIGRAAMQGRNDPVGDAT